MLAGGAGNDELDGGSGADTLEGEPGADTFKFYSIDDSPSGAPDLITALGNTRLDRPAAIDADPFQAGDQAFAFVAAFTHQAGQALMSYDLPSNQTRLQLDGSGLVFPTRPS
jgi:serralysin